MSAGYQIITYHSSDCKR